MRFKNIANFIAFLEYLIITTAQDFNPVDPSKFVFSQAINDGPIDKTKRSHDINKSPVLEFCPSLENADLLTDQEFFEHLVHPCRYDRIQRPDLRDENNQHLPVHVYVRFFIYYLQNLDTHDLQYKLQTLLQMRYMDPRLKFKTVAPHRNHPITGEEDLRKKIWVPHVFFSNERDSSVLGTYGHHILTSISPDGTVIISSRLQATLFCPMDLRKFPFDSQECRATLECWMYNASQVQLHWEGKKPLNMGPDKILTEYVLRNTSTSETMVIADEHDLRHGAFIGNYSSVTFTFNVDRQAGFYMLEYFLPSVMIVAISWVSFYLQADQTAPRAMLGATSMLSFITLSSSQNKILPKVSYIKALEVWSMACTAFIFMSLVEFAFVNTIWRRKKHVELKKVNARNILKHTLTAREFRMALGIDTSRSVIHIPPTVSENEEFNINKSELDKRRSIDYVTKVSENDADFAKPCTLHRSNSLTDLDDFAKNHKNEVNHNLTTESKIESKTDENFKIFDKFVQSNSQPTCEKKKMFIESILKHDDHHHNPGRKTTFDANLPRIDSESSLHNTKIHINRLDSITTHSKFDDLEHRRKSFMIPVILTENPDGNYKMEMDATKVIPHKDNSVEILIDNDSTVNSVSSKSDENNGDDHHHYHINKFHNPRQLYDGWTRMAPQEISHWIDKRSRTFFPFAFAVFNMFYWTFVYLF